MLKKLLNALRRWREDRVTLAMLDRLDPRALQEFETLVRLRRDACEFDSKRRSVAPSPEAHIAGSPRRAHS
jgi:uncharacterized protein YjiS (DUF1127 family)